MNKVFLMGYMGSGKSSLGKRLSRKLGFEFIDLDKLIEERSNMSIEQIFKEKGEQEFRLLEQQALHSCFELQNVVIALGGGTPCFFDNIKLIQQNGVGVYLKMSASALASRLKNAKSIRPLIAGMNEIEVLEFIQQQLGEREKYYLRAQLIVNGLSIKMEELNKSLLEFLDQ